MWVANTFIHWHRIPWYIVSKCDRDLCLLKILSHISSFGFCLKDVLCLRYPLSFLLFYFSSSFLFLSIYSVCRVACSIMAAHTSDRYVFCLFTHRIERTCAHHKPHDPLRMHTYVCGWFYDNQNIWINHK